MIYTVQMDEPKPGAKCSGCGCWEGPFSKVKEIGYCSLTPGDPSPAGRCPDCDGLVYLKDPATAF